MREDDFNRISPDTRMRLDTSPRRTEYSSAANIREEHERRDRNSFKYQNVRIMMEHHAPDDRIYLPTQIIPYIVPGRPSIAEFLFDRAPATDSCYERYTIHHQVWRLRASECGESLHIFGAIRHQVSMATGRNDLPFEIIVSPRTGHALERELFASIGRELAEKNKPFVPGPEVERFNDQMHIAFEEFAKELAS